MVIKSSPLITIIKNVPTRDSDPIGCSQFKNVVHPFTVKAVLYTINYGFRPTRIGHTFNAGEML